jgi:hypothetical protein
MYFPAPKQQQRPEDTANFDVADGFVSFTQEFRYLGSVIHSSFKSDVDVIAKATAAFGALHYCFFSNRRVSLKDKGRVYAVLVLILLHGSECWSLREDLYNRLRVFHNRCVRTLCRVKLRQVCRHRMKQDTLNARVGLQSLDYYYGTSLLRWPWHRKLGPTQLRDTWRDRTHT